LIELLDAELRHCKAEFEAISAELQDMIAKRERPTFGEIEPAIRAIMTRLNRAATRLHDATVAFTKASGTRAQ